MRQRTRSGRGCLRARSSPNGRDHARPRALGQHDPHRRNAAPRLLLQVHPRSGRSLKRQAGCARGGARVARGRAGDERHLDDDGAPAAPRPRGGEHQARRRRGAQPRRAPASDRLGGRASAAGAAPAPREFDPAGLHAPRGAPALRRARAARPHRERAGRGRRAGPRAGRAPEPASRAVLHPGDAERGRAAQRRGRARLPRRDHGADGLRWRLASPRRAREHPRRRARAGRRRLPRQPPPRLGGRARPRHGRERRELLRPRRRAATRRPRARGARHPPPLGRDPGRVHRARRPAHRARPGVLARRAPP